MRKHIHSGSSTSLAANGPAQFSPCIWRRSLAVCLTLLALLCGAAASRAQVQNATVSGIVADSKGSVIPGAAVTLVQTSTGLVLHGPSNAQGVYTFSQLQPGEYTITVESAGFQKTTASLTLTVGQTARVDIVLEVGSATQTVTVNAENAATLDSETSNLDYTVQSKQVNDLPLNGRNPYGLAVLSPGIMPGASFGVGVTVARGAVVAAATNNFESNGGIGGNNEVLLDGVSIVVCCQGQPAVTPSVEFVNQFKVLTNDPPAQYGRTSGAVLNIVSKSGTNSLHGDVYDFIRNDKLDAANFFTKRNGVYPYPGHKDFRAPHRANQYGVLATGPVFIPHVYSGRDRTFFTFNYEAVRNLAPVAGITTVPTALMRQGIFTEAPGPIYDPNSSNSTTTARSLVPAATCNGTSYAAGYCIPASTWNIVATKNLAQMPAPNLSGTTSNYSYVENITDAQDQYNFRVDQNIGAEHRLFVRGTKDKDTHYNADLFNSYTGPGAWRQALTAYLFAAGDVITLNPSTILQFSYGFARQTNLQLGHNFYDYNASNYGYSSTLTSEQQIPGLPVLAFNTLAQIGWQTGFNHWAHYVHSFNSTLLLQHGKHAFTIGYNGKLILENQLGLSNPNSGLSFSTNWGSQYPSGSLVSGQGAYASWAAFLLGYPTSGGLQRQTTPAFNQWWNGLYIQDDWKVLPNLTLNVGVRYDLETGFEERHNNWADFNPTAANPLGMPGGALFLGAGNNPTRTWKMSTDEFSPRFGFSYSATNTTVVRGGFGILFLPTSERGYSDPNIGFSQTTNIPTTSTGYTPAVTSDNPLPNGVQLPAGSTAGIGVSDGSSIAGFQYHNPPSYQEQWNFGIEKGLGQTFTLQLNYVGGHGVHLPFSVRYNDLRPQFFGTPGDTAQVAALQTQVTNPYYGHSGVVSGTLTAKTVQQVQLDAAFPQYTSGAISSIQNGSANVSYQDIGYTNYNAFQPTLLIHRPGGGVSGSVSYVWSKLLGDVSDLTNGFLNTTGNPGIQDSYFLNYEYSTLATDIRHRIVGTATWDIPVGHGKRLGANMPGWANEVVGGWELTTLTDVYSGFPISMGVTGASAFAGTRPMHAAGVDPQTGGGYYNRLGGSKSLKPYLNSASFTVPASFQLGNVPRSWAAIRGPINFDNNVSVIKHIPIHDQLGLELRAEAFNFLNKANFGLPAATFGASTFGQITSQYNLPRNVQVSAKLSF